MTVGQSLKKRMGMLFAGAVSFVLLMIAMRWSSGAPFFQPPGDFGILIGIALVAAFFVFTDTRSDGRDQHMDEL
ncbi:MAG: hypothetical protein KGL46_13430 [Hyphomicrobiales bacterium]|nr:hypothetical protein [Hyphomicrobiales bacterium]